MTGDEWVARATGPLVYHRAGNGRRAGTEQTYAQHQYRSSILLACSLVLWALCGYLPFFSFMLLYL